MKHYYTYQPFVEGFFVEEINTNLVCNIFCLNKEKDFAQRKYALEIELEDKEGFENSQSPRIKLKEISQAQFKKLVEKTQDFIDFKENLQRVKKLTLQRLNASFNAFMQEVLGEDIPQLEMLTWQIQEAQALAYRDSGYTNEEVCPLMVLISQQRGIPLKILCDKCIEKSIQHKNITAKIIGKRQKFQKYIEAAENETQLNLEFSWEED